MASLYRLLLQLFLQDCSSRSRDRYTRKYHVRSEQVSFRCILTANAGSVRTKFSKEIPSKRLTVPHLIGPSKRKITRADRTNTETPKEEYLSTRNPSITRRWYRPEDADWRRGRRRGRNEGTIDAAAARPPAWPSERLTANSIRTRGSYGPKEVGSSSRRC